MDKYTLEYLKEICTHCGVEKGMGANNVECDHTWYPENCDICRERENPGFKEREIISNIQEELQQLDKLFKKRIDESS